MGAEAEKRSHNYLIFRLLVILLGFGLVAFYQVTLGPVFRQNTFRYLYGLLVVYLLFGLAMLAGHRQLSRKQGLLRLQVGGDFVFQALLIWGTGGVLSIFSPLLFVTLVAATSFTGARGAFFLASVVTFFLSLTTAAYVYGFSPVRLADPWHWLLGGGNSGFLVSYLLASVLALYTISALGSRFFHGLRHVQGLHSAILENMAEGLIATDSEGHVLQMNREARRLLGIDALPRGRKLRLDDILPGEGHEPLRRAFALGGRRRLTAKVLGRGGCELPVEVKISTVAGEPGDPSYRIGLVADLSVRLQVEAAERRIRKLEDLHVMALGIAHEIRNPLASIRGCVQEVSRMGREDPRTSRYMGIVCRESDRLDRILEEFLRYARSDPADLVPLDLAEVIDEAVLLLRNRSGLGSRTIHWTRPPERLRIFGDQSRLIQVFLNLGINAIEATSPESGEIRIALRPCAFAPIEGLAACGDLAAGAEVEFSDNGAGIPHSEGDRLFTPFYTTKTRGNGLGLCIVERIVREHMGTIDFSSQEGQGTKFRLSFPLPGSESPDRRWHEGDLQGRQERAVCSV